MKNDMRSFGTIDPTRNETLNGIMPEALASNSTVAREEGDNRSTSTKARSECEVY